jgi:hypothetical protein
VNGENPGSGFPTADNLGFPASQPYMGVMPSACAISARVKAERLILNPTLKR